MLLNTPENMIDTVEQEELEYLCEECHNTGWTIDKNEYCSCGYNEDVEERDEIQIQILFDEFDIGEDEELEAMNCCEECCEECWKYYHDNPLVSPEPPAKDILHELDNIEYINSLEWSVEDSDDEDDSSE